MVGECGVVVEVEGIIKDEILHAAAQLRFHESQTGVVFSVEVR